MIVKLEAINNNSQVAWCCYEEDCTPIATLNGYVNTSQFSQYENEAETIALITLMAGPLRIHAGIKNRIIPSFPSIEKRSTFFSSKYELMRNLLFPELEQALTDETSTPEIVNNINNMLATSDSGLAFTSHFFEYNLFIPFNLIHIAKNKMKVPALEHRKSIIHLLDRELVRQCLYKEKFGGLAQCSLKGLSLKFMAKKNDFQLMVQSVDVL